MIGLTSFFLINFWSSRVGTLKAAFKAYSFNKTSDLFLFVVIVLIFNTLFTLDIPTFLTQVHLYENYTIIFFTTQYNYIEVVSVLFLVCAFIKSAQFGAHI
jgi:NADH:ubiquinone oxidoreductase subunit 5 (subunit L)/multisubunit Na+/H+ antiporter MnhA subunit